MTVGLGVFLVSSVVLAHELLLVRVIAIGHWQHFSSLVISVALLGFGSSGVAVACLGPAERSRPNILRWALLVGAAVALPASIWLAGLVPLNMLELGWRSRQYVYVALYALALLLPFLPTAGYIAFSLSLAGRRVGWLYGLNLLGSGIGAAAGVALLEIASPAELVVGLALVLLVAGALEAWAGRALGPLAWTAALAVLLSAGWAAGWPALVISPFKALPQMLEVAGAQEKHVRHGPLGRVSVVHCPRWGVELPGLLLGPAEKLRACFLSVDGHQAGTVFAPADEASLTVLDEMQSALAFRLWSGSAPAVLLLDARQGLDLWLARRAEAETIDLVEPNPDVARLLRGPLDQYTGRLYSQPGVAIHVRHRRHYLAALREPAYDLIFVSLLDSTSAAGADALEETYLYTVEAFQDMLRALRPGGILAVRVAVTVPNDALRLLATLAAALERLQRPFGSGAVMIRDQVTGLVLASLRPFDADQRAAVRRFAARYGFDIDWLEDLAPQETNRVHVQEKAYFYEAARELAAGRAASLASEYAFEVEPVSDDRPYFFRFFGLKAIFDLADQVGPAWVRYVEKGYLFLWGTLVAVTAAAAVLVLLPLALVRPLRAVRGKAALLVYFALLGLGYIGLEIAFIQRCTLLVGSPVVAMAVVVAGFLLFSGVGSLAADLAHRARRALVLACLGVAAWATAWALGGQRLADLALGAPLAVRLAVALAVVAPAALVMGMPMPAGLRLVGRHNPRAVAWAWAINGFFSVLGALAAKLLAVDAGFSVLVLAGGSCYLAAAAVAFGLRTSKRELMPRP